MVSTDTARHRFAATFLLATQLVLGASTAIAQARPAGSAVDSSAPETPATPSEATVLEARTLFEEGVRLSRAERWFEALEVFRRSSQLVDRARTQFNMAIALDRLGRLRESIAAIDRFLELSDPVADEADRLEAARVRLACERRLVTLVLRLAPSDASVEIDGDAVPIEGAERRVTWDPGDHVVVVRSAGHLAFRETVSLPPGSLVDRTVTLEIDPEAATRPLDSADPATSTPTESAMAPDVPHESNLAEDPVLWIVIGIVAVGVGVGVGLGVHVATEPQPYGGTTGLRF